jgi:hypothetical protein
LIVPGIIFSVWIFFAIYDVAIDGTTDPILALKKSKKLVSGRWFESFWGLFAPGVVFTLLALLTQTVIGWPIDYILKSWEGNSFLFLFIMSLVALINI